MSALWHVSRRLIVAPASILVAAAFFAIATPGFLSLDNAANIAGQIWLLALLAVGQMFAIAARGFDISVGAVAALASTVGALSMNTIGPAGLLAAPLIGLACGTFNGWLIGRAKLQPIVATLGSLILAKGLALLISNDGQVIPLDQPGIVTMLAYDLVFGLNVLGWTALACIILAQFIVRHMTLGRLILMLGGNPAAIDLVGADSNKLQIRAYQLCGLFAGLAGALMTMRAGAGLPTEGAGLELQSIAAAVIGGTSLAGGVANAFAVLGGAIFIQIVLTGLNLSGVSPFLGQVAIGTVIIGSSLLDHGLQKFFSFIRNPERTIR